MGWIVRAATDAIGTPATPTLVLLPGMDGTGRLFQPFVEALGSEVHVQTIAYPPSESLTCAELAAFATSALPRAGPLVILGESFSGPIAVEVAARCGRRVRGLAACWM